MDQDFKLDYSVNINFTYKKYCENYSSTYSVYTESTYPKLSRLQQALSGILYTIK